MSSTDVAVRALRRLEPEDFRALRAIEQGMNRYEYVPESLILKISNLMQRQMDHRLSRLDEYGLIQRWRGPYTGYSLNTAGYDCLAINALVEAGVLESFGKPLGVGKEADVYDALTPGGERVAAKFHRLGRISFRQTRRVRGYIAEHRRVSWLHQSRLAAGKEFEALKLVYLHGVAVPKPIQRNRHVVVMGMIEGAELVRYAKIPKAIGVLEGILWNVRKAYREAEVIHADLSEFNIILKPDWHILIIDWPQYVKRSHPNAEQLLTRDVRNIVRFFRRKHGVKTKLKDALAYIKETA